MKGLQFAVIFLVFSISTLEALRCNHCIPSSGGGRCFNTVETCQRQEEVFTCSTDLCN